MLFQTDLGVRPNILVRSNQLSLVAIEKTVDVQLQRRERLRLGGGGEGERAGNNRDHDDWFERAHVVFPRGKRQLRRIRSLYVFATGCLTWQFGSIRGMSLTAATLSVSSCDLFDTMCESPACVPPLVGSR